MKIQSVAIQHNQLAATLSAETTRLALIEHFGKPDDVGGFGRKSQRGQILKYGETEFHFAGDQDDDTLILIYQENDNHEAPFIELSLKFSH